MIFVYLINDIKYFSSVNLISDDDVHEVERGIISVLGLHGATSCPGKFDNGNRISFYISILILTRPTRMS